MNNGCGEGVFFFLFFFFFTFHFLLSFSQQTHGETPHHHPYSVRPTPSSPSEMDTRASSASPEPLRESGSKENLVPSASVVRSSGTNANSHAQAAVPAGAAAAPAPTEGRLDFDFFSAASEEDREMRRRISDGENNDGRPSELEQVQNEVHRLQQQLIERDGVIHDLHRRSYVAQEDENRKTVIKRGFSVIEKRYVNTTTITDVMRDSMHHLIYTMVDAYGGSAGVLILDVPYNACLGAQNTELKTPILLQSFWEDKPSIPHYVLRELEDLHLFKDIVTQKKGKVLNEWETGVIKQGRGLREVSKVMAVPVVVDGASIALVLMVNGAYSERDPKLLAEVLSELWTSNVLPLINIALDTERKKDTEAKLVTESLQRDEIILTLDTILEEVVSAAAEGTRRISGSDLWKSILQRVADFFEEYYQSDVLVAVTNTEANFRIHRNSATGSGGSSRGAASSSKKQSTKGLDFIYYLFSQSLEHIRTTTMKHLKHPQLRDSRVMRETVESGEPLYCSDCKHMTFPCGHMKMNTLLIVPILFCEEPVGMLGLSNGDFSMSTGRILQSVFTTFWSMIVKATVLSESQRVVSATLPQAICERVKGGEMISDAYPAASVLFANIVAFTEFTKDLTPREVVEYSNLVFVQLDDLARQLHLEKIKLIGDCYMLAGGLADKSGSAPGSVTNRGEQAQLKAMLDFGTKVHECVKAINSGETTCSAGVRKQLDRIPLQLRIGLSEGPVTAGVFGTGKVQYDILGPTVCTATRLESSGRPGTIQISQSVYDAMKDEDYVFEKRKPVCLKGLGLMQTYYVLGRKPPSATAAKPLKPIESGLADKRRPSFTYDPLNDTNTVGEAGSAATSSPLQTPVSQGALRSPVRFSELPSPQRR